MGRIQDYIDALKARDYSDYDKYGRIQQGDYKYTLYEDLDGVVGWEVKVIDKTKEEYGPIANSIEGIPVISMTETFKDCKNLDIAPQIPNSVKYMISTFEGCISLEFPPEIPDGVEVLRSTFRGCTYFRDLSDFIIPDSVTDMYGTFYECEELSIPPQIPDSVTDMYRTFEKCYSLQFSPSIPDGVDIRHTFTGCVLLNEKKNLIADSVLSENENLSVLCGNSENSVINDLPEDLLDDFLRGYWEIKNNLAKEDLDPGDRGYYGMAEANIDLFYEPYGIINQGDYVYELMEENGTQCWNIVVLDKTKEEYSQIPESFCGIPVQIMNGTFKDCTNLKSAPEIPKTITHMIHAFDGCVSLEATPKIPENVSIHEEIPVYITAKRMFDQYDKYIDDKIANAVLSENENLSVPCGNSENSSHEENDNR